MAFSDPQSVTINAVANSLPRTSNGVNSGQFTKDDGSFRLTVSHQYGKRTRRTIRLEHAKVAPDPFSGVNQRYSMTAFVVVDVPPAGYTIAEQKQVADGLVAYLAASSGANVTKLLGGEN